MKLNLGCGAYELAGWENWDEDTRLPNVGHVRVPPIPLDDETVEEVYLGHLLEHFEPVEAAELLHECKRVLVPGGRLGVVVPDTKRVLEHYLRQNGAMVEVPQGRHWRLNDLDAVNAVFLYSTIQGSRHRWSYDRETLCRTLERAGFRLGACIDPYTDPRLSTPQWYNLGVDGFKPGGPA
jgi:predicted SAM-dependent methyltransferase